MKFNIIILSVGVCATIIDSRHLANQNIADNTKNVENRASGRKDVQSRFLGLMVLPLITTGLATAGAASAFGVASAASAAGAAAAVDMAAAHSPNPSQSERPSAAGAAAAQSAYLSHSERPSAAGAAAALDMAAAQSVDMSQYKKVSSTEKYETPTDDLCCCL
ncbi:uncharacterized protein LOC103312790 isoform X1 [Tribolium castaneum]|uniref:Uncharacterized protein n=1 Tax=Tribolium castaneum TaxID=7070 RepID=A0A139WLI3_TRICA|nr:PREDICTED: uncharacterized protein LOC103312790 isoform X2 [Tribolium castaneum]XP_015833421.1 PREDICTED: uncharacterized protein LOC103312790 isoform X2 [Tribolium castaneum]XP_015833422.1 PREDICTED: uncharacterized protein LOC103312790 isoform X2 [Tribolium castaneum]XP_015833423.1 PREDICTED: uncharacterized protein LOC103312790 isoform X2 [Tribolium castaneum]KYB28766.1 hypothetical protein TcasGA2_TC032456 [Tribolium castaneum]|eukprot:XP_015833420.1 PREDICTED: uncharacterized protein LOC103312790 isoform X2 [Tribolium castaneum]